MEEYLFEAVLHGESEIHVTLGDFRVRLAGLTKQFFHARGIVAGKLHGSIRENLHSLIAAKRLEIPEIQKESVIFWRDDFGDLLAIGIFSVRRQSHHFAFIAIFRVADEFADHRVKAAQRVREKHAIEDIDVIPFAARHHGRNEITGAVITEARSLLPRGAVIGAGDVSDVM